MMMRYLLSIFAALSLAMLCASSQASDKVLAPSLEFSIKTFELPARRGKVEDVSIKTLRLVSVKGMSTKGLKRVNARLRSLEKEMLREAKLCRTSADGHPWGYEIAFEKIAVSKRYISAVFKKFMVCAGSPDIEKVALVFARSSGRWVPGVSLVKELFPPSVDVVASDWSDPERVKLDDHLTEKMIDDSKTAGIELDERCDFYLKTAYYMVWVDGQRLKFFPEFNQPMSICQKEYMIVPTADQRDF
ncbi:hypothetical protein OU994_11430 [Pseudoduganella sp. SL102]|uniref:hypothetical protein n=1 Tax=Pseudoduganella sp. SL102 TaxID=2995154 RepID=UPI00248AD158|nr:hypothetical protein [Pseudoduganella sp. SL102]WBS04834.1 hypothetical protein OU994_11430 [Pseudoduganella sp. SL102]